MRNFFITLIVIATGLNACYYDNEEDLYPSSDLNVDQVSYSIHIEPLMKNSCAVAGCHVQGGGGTGLLSTYDEVKGIALNGKLKDRVIVRMDMPPSQPLSANNRKLIQAWIDQGTPK